MLLLCCHQKHDFPMEMFALHTSYCNFLYGCCHHSNTVLSLIMLNLIQDIWDYISLDWYGTDSWYLSSLKTATHLSDIVIIVAADDLVNQGARVWIFDWLSIMLILPQSKPYKIFCDSRKLHVEILRFTDRSYHLWNIKHQGPWGIDLQKSEMENIFHEAGLYIFPA